MSSQLQKSPSSRLRRVPRTSSPTSREIGPVAEHQLNEQGITTFAQIAELKAAGIKRIDDYMPFSDRQVRDWQAQAKNKV